MSPAGAALAAEGSPVRLADPIDDSIFRRDGVNSAGSPAWSSPTYDLTGPMFSVLARVSGKTGKLLERVRYRPYGEARHQWGHDVDGDGDADSTDQSIVTTASGASAVIGDASYDVDADLDRDGEVGTADEAAWNAGGNRVALVKGALSNIEAVIGWSGYGSSNVNGIYSVRNRVFSVSAGRWAQRDPAGYVDGGSLYEYVSSQPQSAIDPSGLLLVSFNGTSSASYDRPGFAVDFLLDYSDWSIYISGPNLPGTNVDDTMDDAIERFCARMCANLSHPVDLVGYSRGAAIAARFAKYVGERGCNCGAAGGCNTFDVRFLGMYDAVIEAISGGWSFRPFTIIDRVHNSTQITKQGPDAWSSLGWRRSYGVEGFGGGQHHSYFDTEFGTGDGISHGDLGGKNLSPPLGAFNADRQLRLDANIAGAPVLINNSRR